MYKTIELLFALLLSAGAAMAQGINPSTNTGGQTGNAQAVGMNNFTAFVKRTDKAVLGSPYADSRWLTAHLNMTNAGHIPPLPLRYDVLNKRLVMRSSDSEADSAQLNDNTLVSFELDEPASSTNPAYKRYFRRFTESAEPAKMSDYVEVLHQGKFSLLKHYEKNYVKAVPNNGMAETNDRINDKVTYYISRPGTSALPVKLTLKGLMVSLPDFAPALKAAPGAQNARSDMEWSAVLKSVDPSK
jgi:hypothetical protein